MGYCINVDVDGVKILKKNEAKALAAINAIKPGHYSWVDHTGKYTKLVDALKEWRYEAHTENDNVVVHFFTGEKSGDCEIMWKALAPFIVKGASVEYLGEDGCRWRYLFDGKKMKEQSGKTVWV